MGIRVIEEKLRVVTARRRASAYASVESVVTLPEKQLPIERILQVAVVPQVQGTRVEDDRVLVEGVLSVELVYAAGPGPEGVHRVQWDQATEFDSVVEVEGIGVDAAIIPEVKVESLEPEAFGGRRLKLGVVLQVTVDAVESREESVVVEISGTQGEKIKVERAPWPVEIWSGQAETTQYLEEEFELEGQDIDRIIRVSGQAVLGGVRVDETGITATGEVPLSLLYLASPVLPEEEGDVEIPATLVEKALGAIAYEVKLPIPGPGAPEVWVDLTEIRASLTGSRGLSVEVGVQMRGRLVRPKEYGILADATCLTGKNLELRPAQVGTAGRVGEADLKTVVSGVLRLPEEKGTIQEALGLVTRATIGELKVSDDKVVVDGTCQVELSYLSESEEWVRDPEVNSWSGVLPFTLEMDIAGASEGMAVQDRVWIEEMDWEVQDDLRSISVELVPRAKAIVYSQDQYEVVKEAVLIAPISQDPPSMTFVVIQKGDTVWKLSRTYGVTDEAIRKANHLAPDEGLEVGQKLYIPRGLVG